MAGTNFTGDPTAAEAPSPAPGVGVAPIVNIPDDGDDLSAASVNQSFKTLANFVAFLTQRFTGWRVNDDFTGTLFNQSIWQALSLGTGVTGTFPDDSANGAYGAINLTATESGGGADIVLLTEGFAVGTADFDVQQRIRITSDTSAGARIQFGIGTSSAGAAIIFIRDASLGNSHWWLYYSDGASGGQIDTGVAPSSTYQNLEISRVGGVITAYIGGVQKAQVTPAAITLQAGFRFEFDSVGSNGTMTAKIDYMRLR